ncbi:MAG: tetratricopeptide repeat protein, partial [bacterium]|nr:tetratricopeptide repeat protein [bacterium]
MRPSYRVLMTGVVLLAVAVNAGAQTVAEQLEKGIYNEETAGDLDTAMNVYRAIVADAGDERPQVAEALYRLALCHRKRGETVQACHTLRRLIYWFPDQTRFTDPAGQMHAEWNSAAFAEMRGARLVRDFYLGKLDREDRRLGTMGFETEVYEQAVIRFTWDIAPATAAKTKFVRLEIKDEAKKKHTIDLPVDVKTAELETLGIPGGVLTPGKYQVWLTAAFDESSEMGAAAAAPLSATRILDEPSGDDRISALSWTIETIVVKPMPYTQIALFDVLPDGVLEGKSIQQRINSGDEPVAEGGYHNSPMVKVAKMYDGQDRDVEFTSNRTGEHIYYAFKLNEPVQPGEPMLLGSDVRVYRLVRPVPGETDTFEYKLTHYPSANVPTRRIERYRLPEGAKLVLLQPKELVQRVVNGRTEFGRDEIVPVDGGVTTHFRYRLPGAKLSDAAMVRDEEEEAPAFKPSVVSTVPANGATDVDPALSEIRVTFDRDMETDRMWSWVQESADTFP